MSWKSIAKLLVQYAPVLVEAIVKARAEKK
jgi:hypothetical protein